MLGGEVTAVFGNTRNDMPSAPVVAGVHHFRERHNFIPESADDPDLEWAEADAEWSYTVLAKIAAEQPTAQPVTALFQHSGLQPRFYPDHIIFYGSEAAIMIEGHYGHGPLHLHTQADGWQEIPLPPHIIAAQPDIADDTQRNWTILAQEFVADIQGEANSGYQTFEEGWLYQEIIEAVRQSEQWVETSSWQC